MATDSIPTPDPATLQRDYAPQLEYCDALLRRVWELRATGSELTSAYTYTQAAILGRAIGTFRAALDLLRSGHPIQTWMLARALFEDLIAALWLASPDKREEALAALFRQEDHIALVAEKTMRKHQDRVSLKPTDDPELEAAEPALADMFGRYGERTWFPGLHRSIGHVEKEWEKRGGKRGELSLYYDVYQRHANLHVHNTIQALRKVEHGAIPRLRYFSYGQTDSVDEIEMMTAFSMVVFCFREIADLVIEETKGIKKPFVDLDRIHQTTFNEDARPSRRRQLVGRNDPCWCGSGEKFKRCHGR